MSPAERRIATLIKQRSSSSSSRTAGAPSFRSSIKSQRARASLECHQWSRQHSVKQAPYKTIFIKMHISLAASHARRFHTPCITCVLLYAPRLPRLTFINRYATSRRVVSCFLGVFSSRLCFIIL